MLLEKHCLLIFRDIFEALWSFPSPSTTLGYIFLPGSMSSQSSHQSKHRPSAESSPECPFLFCWEIQPLPKLPYPSKIQELDPQRRQMHLGKSPQDKELDGFSGCSSAGCKRVRIPRGKDAQG